jgi:serine/threonine protein phosphatase 1
MFNPYTEPAKITIWNSPLPRRVFVVADLHGEYEVIWQIRDFIDKELELTESDLIVFTGDYIDRGPDPMETVETIIDLCARYKSAALAGNHEDSFMDAFKLTKRTCDRGDDYLSMYRGGVTVTSYFRDICPEILEQDYPDLAAHTHQLPIEHIRFFLSLKEGLLLDRYLFTHAPCGREQTLEQLTLNEVLRAKRGDCDEEGNYPHLLVTASGERIVNVHGHKTILPQHVCDYRIGIDTGCGKDLQGYATMLEIRPDQEMKYELYEEFYHFNRSGRIDNPFGSIS